jgi:hypothetical protein
MWRLLLRLVHLDAGGSDDLFIWVRALYKQGPKGLSLSTWVERTLKLEYMDSYGSGQEASGTLFDLYPDGLVMLIGEAKTVICWERLLLCELVED